MDFVHILIFSPNPYTLIYRRAGMGRNHTRMPMSRPGLEDRNFKEQRSPKLRKHIFLSCLIKFTTNLPFTSNTDLGKQKGTSQTLKETNS